MGKRPVLLPSLLLLLLGFFSTQGSLTGQVIREQPLVYDLTHDEVVDMQDLQEVMDLASYELYATAADFNADGVVDQLDVDLLSSSLDL